MVNRGKSDKTKLTPFQEEQLKVAKKVKEYASTVVIAKGEKSAQAQKLMAVMSLGVKKGETVTVTVEGDDEETAAANLEKFFRENL